MAAASASLDVQAGADKLVLAFAGQLDAAGAAPLWRRAVRAVRGTAGRPLVLDLAAVTLCDMAGAAFLAAIETAHGAPALVQNEQPQTLALLARARAASGVVNAPVPPPVLTLRQFAAAGFRRIDDVIVFIGEGLVATLRVPSRFRMLRVPDLLLFADQAGVRSLPLVVLLGYLMGLILAFQSAIPMRQFGADLFVANLVAISLIRELGPLLASVVLAGRTGSAFAAEIGTMKVNEEIDALVTMGLDPMTMLVLPRLVAAVLVMPVMTIVLEIAGIAGMATVLRAFGFPMVAIARQVQGAVTTTDLFGGLFKAMCFGAVVAAIGCRAGLSTGTGPRAVGRSATAAVVGGIVATILLDGVFALIFYRLGI